MKLLTILSLILALLLFPPATLALISNNAIPGDVTYPIKRGLENVILKVASISPQTQAWFSIERSNRRFEEAKILLVGGKTQATDSLDELVTQTQSVSVEISQIQDPVKKQELTQKLTDEIKKYDQGLEKIKQEIPQVPNSTSTPQQPVLPTTKPTFTPRPTSTPTGPTVTPIPSTSPSPGSTAQPTTAPISTPTPTPTPPTPTPEGGCDNIVDPIDRARCKLEGIQVNLKTNASQDKEQDKTSSNTDRETKTDNNDKIEHGNSNLTPKIGTDTKEHNK